MKAVKAFGRGVVRARIPILIAALLLLIPAVYGMRHTRINYDMLDYLPADMETVIGQDELMEEFGKGAFSFLILEDMPTKDAAALKAKIEEVGHVESVLCSRHTSILVDLDRRVVAEEHHLPVLLRSNRKFFSDVFLRPCFDDIGHVFVRDFVECSRSMRQSCSEYLYYDTSLPPSLDPVDHLRHRIAYVIPAYEAIVFGKSSI